MRVQIEDIRNRSIAAFEKVGVSTDDAKIITEVLLETELRGVFTHGFMRLERYINCIRSGGIKTDGNYEVAYDSPSWTSMDGKDNLGIVISYKAMKLAMEKAKKTGVGIVNVRGSHHFGAAGYYTSMCADNDMVGMSMSNGDILIAATGSGEKTIGNNPFSYAFPANKYGKIVYDIAMSYTSDRKVVQMDKEGKKLPEGWIIDKDGKPTTDPGEYEKGGTLLPFGGYKGYGLAMMVETLAATLSGAAMTKNVHAWNTDENCGGNVGHFFMALDISKLGNPEEYKKRVDSMIDEIKNSKKADGCDKIYYPGEIEMEKLAKCKEVGYVEILDETMESVERIEKELGLR
ncbi:MAG: Ldh family oxidoreductase [Ruminococcaceae bacterium]|nr:Ldh family oxidoreductase [Oscillospiraceae bacterium]